jgi:purine-binding chemotaxis protein CheW
MIENFEKIANLAGADGSQYLTFRLGLEEYAIEILNVQEIRSYDDPTRMVNAPVFVKGVINLRGVIVPIVDLRLKLMIEHATYTEFTVVIVLNLNGLVIGAVVDAVSDVVSFHASLIKPAPQFENKIDSRFITGLVDLNERLLMVMNLETLLGYSDLGMRGAGVV